MNLIYFLDLCSDIANDETIGPVIKGIYDAIRIGVPIILIIVGMVGMGKAIAQQKEDEIKKAQSVLVKQAVAAVIVFLMLSGVKILVGAIGGTTDERNCIDMILNGKTTEKANDNNGGQSTAADPCPNAGKACEKSPGVSGVWTLKSGGNAANCSDYECR